MRYGAYSDYRESEITWYKFSPVHWKSLRFKYSFNQKAKTSNPQIGAGSISFGNVIYKDSDSIAKETLDSYQEVLPGEFLINPLNMNYDLISLRTALSRISVVVSTGYIVLKSNGGLNKEFAKWLLHVFDVEHMKTLGSGVRQTITYADIGNSYFLKPSEEEQIQIANFLDRETIKIDTLIEKQKQLIKLLQEKRQAVISHAVTKGLNPDAKMKESGVEWLGEVPENWLSLQIRRILPIMEQGKSPECDNKAADVHEWGVLKTSCVNRGVYNSGANKTLPERIKPFPQYEVKNGDVLMSRASGSIDLIGSVAYVYKTRPRMLLSDKVFRLHLATHVDRLYFSFLMRSSYMRANIERAISGAEGMANNITKGSVMGFRFALPPLDEQQSIADEVSEKLDKLGDLTKKAKSAIGLMKERRTALISAAVTGKIDVRNAA